MHEENLAEVLVAYPADTAVARTRGASRNSPDSHHCITLHSFTGVGVDDR